ncbi:relaxase/mobilization nuclease domain-containing protein [Terasakiella pusilla]|uniref:relaxase/mobilization nuclease domain-containing protein n=1 Tax=Terasakiella pusilla TaxID=64973 RepID=UPI00048D81B4|nr:relaxase/mobilization nuclease domain-containing protein [Terasakiella pusilla]
MVFDDEEYRRIKGGSVNLGEERLMKHFFAKSGRPSSGFGRSRRAARIRYNNYRNYVGDQGKREAVLKVVSAKKSASSVRALVKYISREDEAERVELHDQFGLPTDKEVIKNWGLRTDGENRREDGTWRNNQAWHLVCSIQKEGDVESAEALIKLEAAVRGFVAENFAQHYFHVIWTIHEDTEDHPHAHLVIKAKPDRGNRLHFDRTGEMIDILRDSFAKHLQDVGLDYVATRREDRHHIRRKVLSDKLSLRSSFPAGGHRVEGPILLHLAQSAKPEKQKWSLFDKKEKCLVPDLFKRVYLEPETAYKNWLWLIQHPNCEGRRRKAHRFGIWVLTTRPDVIGKLVEGAHKPKNGQEVISALKGWALDGWPQNWQPILRRTVKKKADKEKTLVSLSRMFRNGISNRAERFEVMQSEWSDLLYEVRQARQKQRERQGPVKSSQRSGWSL